MLIKRVVKTAITSRVYYLYQPGRCIESKASVESASGCPFHQTTEDVEWENARPFKEIPGPTTFELIRDFLPGGVYYKKSATDLIKGMRSKYGDFCVMPGVFGRSSILMTFDPDIIQKVFRNEGQWPNRRNFDSAYYYRAVHKKDYFQGMEGLVMTHGEKWGEFRTAVNPILMQPKNARQYLTKMIPVNNEFLLRIREIRDPITLEMPDTFLDDINRLAFESVAAIALDQELGLIRRNRDRPEAKLLLDSIRDFFDLAYDLDIKPSFWKIIKTPKFYKMMEVNENMFQTTKKFVDEALERIDKQQESGDNTGLKSVLEQLAKKNKLIAVVTAMDLLLGAVDTTTTTLSGILFGISKNPEKQRKLREEVLQILPEKHSIPTLDQMTNLPYLRACIKEGIRMYPLGPGTVRIMPKDIVLNGYQVPQGTDVAMANNTILSEAKYFPKPDEFIPERWLRTEESEPYKPSEVNPFVYLPFGFGPRSCAGKRIVELELELTVMRLVRNFEIEFNYPVIIETHFIARPGVPLKFKFTEIDN